MNISIKDMILSFAAGLIIFSLLMVFVCVGIFNSEIDVAASDVPQISDSEKIDLHKAVVFTLPTSDGEALDFAVLAMLDEERKEIYLTAVYGDYLMNYRDSLSYVSSVYRDVGVAMLPELVKAFSGVTVSESDITSFESVINYAEFKTELSSYLSQNPEKFGEIFASAVNYSEINFKDIPLAVEVQKTENTNERIQVIDIESSVDVFKSLVG